MQPMNPSHLWALRGALTPYAKWLVAQHLRGIPRPKLPSMPPSLKKYAEVACEFLQKSRLEVSGTMRKHQLKLADRQCRMSELSSRIQKLVVMLTTSLYASSQENPIVQQAAEILCRDLARELLGNRPSDDYFRTVTRLGADVAEGGFPSLDSITPEEILMKYDA